MNRGQWTVQVACWTPGPSGMFADADYDSLLNLLVAFRKQVP